MINELKGFYNVDLDHGYFEVAHPSQLFSKKEISMMSGMGMYFGFYYFRDRYHRSTAVGIHAVDGSGKTYSAECVIAPSYEDVHAYLARSKDLGWFAKIRYRRLAKKMFDLRTKVDELFEEMLV